MKPEKKQFYREHVNMPRMAFGAEKIEKSTENILYEIFSIKTDQLHMAQKVENVLKTIENQTNSMNQYRSSGADTDERFQRLEHKIDTIIDNQNEILRRISEVMLSNMTENTDLEKNKEDRNDIPEDWISDDEPAELDEPAEPEEPTEEEEDAEHAEPEPEEPEPDEPAEEDAEPDETEPDIRDAESESDDD